jgi:hypothetical protein
LEVTLLEDDLKKLDFWKWDYLDDDERNTEEMFAVKLADMLMDTKKFKCVTVKTKG